MLTGSVAMNFYAVPRMTRDIDIVVELTLADVERVVTLLPRDFYLDGEAAAEAVRSRGMFNAIDTAHVVKVDFVVRKDTEYRREEFSRRRPAVAEGLKFSIVTAEDLILSKLDWARDTRSQVQLDDVRNLVASVEGLDREYVKRWAARLGLERLYREIGG